MAAFPITLPEDVRMSISEVTREAMQNLVFRRVQNMNLSNSKLLKVEYHGSDEDGNPTTRQIPVGHFDPTEFTKEEFEKNLGLHYSSFFGFTEKRSLRSNDEFEGKIHFASNNYAQYDVNAFSWKEKQRAKYTPRHGDLICMIVGKNWKHDKPEAKKWFICSDQFFRMWTLLMYDDHDSFNAYGPNMEEKVVGSDNNKLAVNTFRRWVANHKNCDVPMDAEEREKAFHWLRTEQSSKNHSHIYLVLVLILRFGKFPCHENHPKTKKPDVLATCKGWDLPDNFVKDMIGFAYDPKISGVSWDSIENSIANEDYVYVEEVETMDEDAPVVDAVEIVREETTSAPKFSDSDFPSWADMAEMEKV